jgi:hypothetical protein
MAKLDKNLTGFAGEYFVAAELTRRGFSVAVTVGNTKTIDLFAEFEGKAFQIQVKSIQRKQSISFNLKRDNIRKEAFYVFVNLNVEDYTYPEFFILSGSEVSKHLKLADSGRDWIDYNYLVRLGAQNQWSKIS